jgi:4'-phosphopantetheinyl transferase
MRGCYALYLNSSGLDFLPAPEHPDLRRGEVHVWRLDLDDGRWPGPEHLPVGERERAASFLREQIEARWTASRWGLREVLARYLGQSPEEIELAEDKRGKPRLAQEPPPLHFNLSHSAALALVAISQDREVGVDVERIEPERDFVALAERALAPADVAAIRDAPEPERAAVFYERWTHHEAKLKCLGVGLGAPPPQDLPVCTETLEVDSDYAAAVAAAASGPMEVLLFAG